MTAKCNPPPHLDAVSVIISPREKPTVQPVTSQTVDELCSRSQTNQDKYQVDNTETKPEVLFSVRYHRRITDTLGLNSETTEVSPPRLSLDRQIGSAVTELVECAK